MTFSINDESWSKELESGLSEYMDQLMYSVDEESMETESGELFCGCDVCYWREVLFYVTPRIIKASEEGKVELDGYGPA